MHSPKKRLPTRARRRQPVTGGRNSPRGGHSCNPPGDRPGCGTGPLGPDRCCGGWPLWRGKDQPPRSTPGGRREGRKGPGRTRRRRAVGACERHALGRRIAPCRRSGSRCSCRGLSFRKQVICADGTAGHIPNSGNQAGRWRLPSKLDARQRCLCRPGLIGQRVQRQAAFTAISAKSVFHAAKLHWA